MPLRHPRGSCEVKEQKMMWIYKRIKGLKNEEYDINRILECKHDKFQFIVVLGESRGIVCTNCKSHVPFACTHGSVVCNKCFEDLKSKPLSKESLNHHRKFINDRLTGKLKSINNSIENLNQVIIGSNIIDRIIFLLFGIARVEIFGYIKNFDSVVMDKFTQYNGHELVKVTTSSKRWWWERE